MQRPAARKTKPFKPRDPSQISEEETVVAAYAAGCADASLEALELYEPFLANYRQVFEGNPVVSHREVRRWLALFIDVPEARTAVLIGQDRPLFHASVRQVCQWLEEALAEMDPEDIEAEMITAFLGLARRYDPLRGRFGSMLSSFFRYRLLDRLSPWMKRTQSLPIELKPQAIGALDTEWIYGDACSPLFEDLTPFERWLLVEHYVHKRSVRSLSKQIGLTWRQTKDRLKQVTDRLQQAARSARLLAP